MAASLAAFLLSAFPLPGSAQEGDLPGRVGRVADFAGQLFLSPQDRPDDWDAIGINYPITSGANLWASGDGRAEVDYGGGQFRLAGDTNVHVSRLDDALLALFVAQGQVIVRVRVQEPRDASRIDTPNTQVTLTRPGLYRIDVAPDRQSTTLTVREGEAILLLGIGAQQVLPGQVVSVIGANPVGADVRCTQGADGFDAWAAERDRRYARSRSAAFVSRQMVGYADLDQHGTWQTYQEYGAVWFPTAVAPNLLPVPASLAASAPVMSVAPPLAPPARQTPPSGQQRDIPPPAASTHAAAQRVEPAAVRTGERPGTPASAGSSSPQYRSVAPAPNMPAQRESVRSTPAPAVRQQDVAAPAVVPSPGTDPAPQGRRDARTRDPSGATPSVQPPAAAVTTGTAAPAAPPSSGLPVSRVPQPNRVTPPPASPSSAAPVGRAAPAAVSPAIVAPAPNAPVQTAPAAPANVRGARGGSEKSAPESPPTGTKELR